MGDYEIGRDLANLTQRHDEHVTDGMRHGVNIECAGCGALRARVEALEIVAAQVETAAVVAIEAADDAEVAANVAGEAAEDALEAAADAEETATETATDDNGGETEEPAETEETIPEIEPDRVHPLHRRL